MVVVVVVVAAAAIDRSVGRCPHCENKWTSLVKIGQSTTRRNHKQVGRSGGRQSLTGRTQKACKQISNRSETAPRRRYFFFRKYKLKAGNSTPPSVRYVIGGPRPASQEVGV